jgi:hypothetical protein
MNPHMEVLGRQPLSSKPKHMRNPCVHRTTTLIPNVEYTETARTKITYFVDKL